MFNKLRDALKIKEIRVKLLFTLLMIIIIRIGCQMPVPGVDPNYFRNWLKARQVMRSTSLMHSQAVRS